MKKNHFQACPWDFQSQPKFRGEIFKCAAVFRIQFLLRVMNLALIWNTVSDVPCKNVAESWGGLDEGRVGSVNDWSDVFVVRSANTCCFP